ncbi:hypothetical protein H9P43_002979 [Blastocladiella emersonii ATCC 22665]|nr:hypothetical protein H9P43_002979 [Blastocladiella emersonii ATCC 22665]
MLGAATPPPTPPSPVCLIGHCCHDTLVLRNGDGHHRVLGGSVAYMARFLHAADVPYHLATAVGADFAFAGAARPAWLPPLAPTGKLPTTHYVNDFSATRNALADDREEHVRARCADLTPALIAASLPSSPPVLDIACVVPIVGEVSLPTLAWIRRTARLVLADAQGLVRRVPASISPTSPARVERRAIDPAAYACIDFLKVGDAEAQYVCRAAAATAGCTLLVTHGGSPAPVHARAGRAVPECEICLPDGSTVIVPGFAVPADKCRDPTGCGDAFLAGVVVGLRRGLGVAEAVRVGHSFGALNVQHVGIPPDGALPPLLLGVVEGGVV